MNYKEKCKKYKEKSEKISKILYGGAPEVVTFNEKFYSKVNYSDMVEIFPMSEDKLKKYTDADVFARVDERKNFFSFLHSFVTKSDNTNPQNIGKKFIRLPRTDEIFELTKSENIDEINLDTMEMVRISMCPTGVYSFLSTEINYNKGTLYLVIKNLTTNTGYRLFYSPAASGNLTNLNFWHSYIPIVSDEERINKQIESLEKNFPSSEIMERLWKDRISGDYNFNGLKAHSVILSVSSDFVKVQLRRNLDEKVTHYFSENSEIDHSDEIYLLLYVLYHNNLSGFDKRTTDKMLKNVLDLCDYYQVESTIVEYIKKVYLIHLTSDATSYV